MKELEKRRSSWVIGQWIMIAVGLVFFYVFIVPILLTLGDDLFYDSLPEWAWAALEAAVVPLQYLYIRNVTGYADYIDWFQDVLQR